MKYYFCIYRDNSISKDFIKRNLTSKQLKYAIRDYVYNLNNGRINKSDIQLLSSSLIYDIRNGRAHRKYNIFKIFTNDNEFNDFLKENGIEIKDNKVKLSNIMKYEPKDKTKLSNFYKNYDKKLSYEKDKNELSNFCDLSKKNEEDKKEKFIGKGNVVKCLSRLLD